MTDILKSLLEKQSTGRSSWNDIANAWSQSNRKSTKSLRNILIGQTLFGMKEMSMQNQVMKNLKALDQERVFDLGGMNQKWEAYQGFLEGKWNPDLMTLLMEPTMYMVMALCEKAEIPYKLDSADDEDVEEIMGDKAVEKIEQEIGALDQIRRKAVQQVSPQSVPTDVREVIEQTEIQPSLLEKVEEVKSNSLLGKGE